MSLRDKRRKIGEIAIKKLKEETYQEYEKKREKVSKYVLTISASDYVSRNGKIMGDYDFASVDGTYVGSGKPSLFTNSEDLDFSVLEAKGIVWKRARKLGAEVVVDTKASIAYNSWHFKAVHYMGTALILKENGSKVKQEIPDEYKGTIVSD